MSEIIQLARTLAGLPESERAKIIRSLTEAEAKSLWYDWRVWARDNQIPPEESWRVWILFWGRGSGKTRTGAETVRQWAKEGHTPIALVGKTKADVHDTMIELGDSAILNISPPWETIIYVPTKRRLTWPDYGVEAIIYSGDEPSQLEGPEHAKAWVDELAKFNHPRKTWDNLMFGMRRGSNPQVLITTTPRPIPIIKELVVDAKADKDVIITKGHLLDNVANLPDTFVKYIIKKYEGTRLGRQELAGDVLDDNPDALWNRGQIDILRMTEHPDLTRVVVAIDPAVSAGDESSETGIIVAGIGKVGLVLHGYILADLTMRGRPDEWAKAAVAGYHNFAADRVVGEVNNGGDMVEYTVRTIEKNIPFTQLHASRGKYIRAEPVSALYEQSRIHHVGYFPELEDQLCEWVIGDTSPDRLDALVWAITELMLEAEEVSKPFMVATATDRGEKHA